MYVIIEKLRLSEVVGCLVAGCLKRVALAPNLVFLL